MGIARIENKLNGKPQVQGVYIHGGKVVFVK